MKKILPIFCFYLFLACSVGHNISKKDTVTDYAAKFAKSITAENLKTHLYIFASDEFEGRDTGEPGHKKDVNYLKD